jgi:putative effector of murein hydrolase
MSQAAALQNVVQLWVYLSATPLFGLTATVSVYVLAQMMSQRLDHAPWANPVLWTVLVLSLFLTLSGTAYPTYFSGAQFIHFLLGPAVVALAWPMWQRRAQLRARAGPILLAALAGGVVTSLSAVLIGWALGLPHEVLASLAPKSVTAPVAMGIAERLGGIPALAAVGTLFTGLTGALAARPLFQWLGIPALEVRGFALGSISHGIGAARAMQVHPDAGAYAGLALGVQVVLASLLMPVAQQLWLRLAS